MHSAGQEAIASSTQSLSGSDPDGDDLGFIVAEQPAHGLLSGVGGDLTYTADFGFKGFRLNNVTAYATVLPAEKIRFAKGARREADR